MTTQFTDSIQGNYELAKELIQGLPGTARPRCKRAGETMVALWDKLKAESPNDPAVALGCVFALFYLAEKVINATERGDTAEGDRLIITLNGE